MKRLLTLILILSFFGCGLSFGQTAIEKNTVDGDGLLDFPSGTTKGIILPAIETLPSSPANGTFLYDKNDQRVKVYENGTWVNLTDEGDNSAVLPYNGTDSDRQSVIGATSTSVDGTLVLESSNKSLILPKIASPHTNVPSPYPGMMCYDTDAKALAVFDGEEWSYWK
ncbi:hypothetical protein [Echinicola rosea]|uniref:Uncharacterized protein n=1 Tax=Echinicola rosea TaxID=1807691 RepID=A0ABQ1UU30_9BACT|nr:hypothetical protein [Echinicola rosea]GGF25081.1 hypothetical protein GCM10011339_11500 [Echinicola rosea]